MSLENSPQPAKTPETPKTAEQLEAEKVVAKQKIEDESKKKREDLRNEMGLGEVLVKVLEGFNDVFLGNSEIMKNFWEEIFGKNQESSTDTTQSSVTSSKESKTSVPSGYSEKVKASPSALKALQSALKNYPEWKSYAGEAETKFKIPSSVTFAIMYLESGFKPYAKNKDSGAAGLGQFIPSTWKAFIADNPEFAGKDQFDPRASIFATAWYCRQNADHLGIDMGADDAAAKIYEAHHNGEGGYRQMEAYRAGKISSIKVPKSYADHGYDTSQKYTDHIVALSKGVQATAESYETLLA